ncbi:hypothetical protein KI387_037709, partial [Taxus chinensis]
GDGAPRLEGRRRCAAEAAFSHKAVVGGGGSGRFRMGPKVTHHLDAVQECVRGGAADEKLRARNAHLSERVGRRRRSVQFCRW